MIYFTYSSLIISLEDNMSILDSMVVMKRCIGKSTPHPLVLPLDHLVEAQKMTEHGGVQQEIELSKVQPQRDRLDDV